MAGFAVQTSHIHIRISGTTSDHLIARNHLGPLVDFDSETVLTPTGTTPQNDDDTQID